MKVEFRLTIRCEPTDPTLFSEQWSQYKQMIDSLVAAGANLELPTKQTSVKWLLVAPINTDGQAS